MRPILISMAPSATDRDGICQSQTPSGAGNLTINGALASGGVATLGAVTAPTVYGASDESGKTFTFTGTDKDGRTLVSAATTGPTAGATVTCATSFKTITQVAVSAATTGAIEIGVAGTGISRAVPLDIHQSSFNVALDLDVTGTINATVQYTFDDPFGATYDPYLSTAQWIDHDTMVSLTADEQGNFTMPVRAIRLKVNSSSSGSANLNIIQTGMGYR